MKKYEIKKSLKKLPKRELFFYFYIWFIFLLNKLYIYVQVADLTILWKRQFMDFVFDFFSYLFLYDLLFIWTWNNLLNLSPTLPLIPLFTNFILLRQGYLSLISQFILQFLYYPVLGSLLLTIISSFLAFLLRKASKKQLINIWQ